MALAAEIHSCSSHHILPARKFAAEILSTPIFTSGVVEWLPSFRPHGMEAQRNGEWAGGNKKTALCGRRFSEKG